MPAGVILREAGFKDLDPATLYRLLRLRVDVFVVEQRCPYPELDGRDLEPGARHLWLERDGEPLAYLRLLSEPDGTPRIGRVVVSRNARGSGLARDLMVAALAHVGDRPAVLDAQAHLLALYASFGFRITGPEFLEDGIPHVPMRRESTRPEAAGRPVDADSGNRPA